MNRPNPSPRLSILIPTYNRAPRLARVLHNLDDELARSGLAGQVDVLVSDNASTDSTPQVLASFQPANFRLFHFCQPTNLGMDRNMQFLYQQASSDYIWFFSDDDTFMPGSVRRVYDVLSHHSPDVLTSSFPNVDRLLGRAMRYSSPVEVIEDPKVAAELLPIFSWISIYILRRILLHPSEKHALEPYLGTNFWFVALAYSILYQSSRPRLGVMPEALADGDECRQIRFPPETYTGFWRIYTHPFVLKHSPHLLVESQRKSYYFSIYFLFQVKAGLKIVDDAQAYEEAVKKLEFRPAWLLASPKTLLKFLLLKFAPGAIPAVVSFALAAIGWLGGDLAERYRYLRSVRNS